MNEDVINDLMTALITCQILNIYTSDEKIIIGVGGIPPENIEFNSFGVIIKDINKKTWYSFNHIKKIEVY